MSGIHDKHQFPELYAADERTVQAAHDTYQAPEQFTVAKSARPESRNGEVKTQQLNPALLEYLYAAAGGDARRIRDNGNGTYTVTNNPQR